MDHIIFRNELEFSFKERIAVFQHCHCSSLFGNLLNECIPRIQPLTTMECESSVIFLLPLSRIIWTVMKYGTLNNSWGTCGKYYLLRKLLIISANGEGQVSCTLYDFFLDLSYFHISLVCIILFEYFISYYLISLCLILLCF